MGPEIAFVFAGLALLLFSGDLLVRGAVGMAYALKIPALAIGLTIVAFGTSAPELFITVNAVLADAPGVAMGNIIGSNIANVLLVLGAPAIIYPIRCAAPGLGRNAVAMLAATAVFAYFGYVGGVLDATRGAVLLAGLFIFLTLTGLMVASGRVKDAVTEDLSDVEAAPRSGLKIVVFLVIGLIGLPLGAHILVDNAASIARELAIREEIIGLTVVALGTSLPELATVIVAAFRRHAEVALGNVVGSNLFNLLAVGGAAGVAGGAPFSPESLAFDIPVMAAASVALAIAIWARWTIYRLLGLAFVTGYGVYIYMLGKEAGLI